MNIAMPEARRGWEQSEIQYIKDSWGALTLHQISSKLGRSYSSVSKKVFKLQLDNPRAWTEEEDKILVENYEYNPTVFDLFPSRSYDAVKQRASKTFKLSRDTGNCPVNHKFFDSLNEKSAYVLGFFTADGCVERAPITGARISFSQCKEDVDVLYKVREAMESKSPLCFKNNRNEVTLYIHNGYIVNTLHSMGYDNNKSITADLPVCVTDEHMPAFIRGLTDGDGSVITITRDRVVLLGTYKLLSKIRTFLIRKGLSSGPSVNKKSNVNVYALSYSRKEDLINFCKLVYSGSNIHMDRKYKKAMDMLDSLQSAFARGVSPRTIYSAQIKGLLLGNAKDNLEGKTDESQIGPQRLHAEPTLCGDGIVQSL